MAGPLISKKAEASGIIKCTIYGNNGGEVELIDGIISFNYYESILQDVIKVVITYADSGYSINNTTLLEGLPVVGQERVSIQIVDNNNTTKKVTLYVNSAVPNYSDANKQIITLDLVSKEYILNEQVRVRKRFDGKISDSITRILTDSPPFGLGSQKKIDVEQTVNLYNFMGNNRKPLYVCSWLSKKSIPSTGGGKGKTAGYFFFETEAGFNYKSVDTLMQQSYKAKLIYNVSTDERGSKIPQGYDGKILEYNVDYTMNNMNAKMGMGVYNTKIIKFDPFNCYYESINKQVSDTYETGGKNLPQLNNKEFPNKETNAATKTTYLLVDTGVLPTGNTKQQIDKSKEKNLEETDIINQAMMRYNSLFATKVSITIPGMFKLNAGDTIFVDSPQIENSNNTDVNQQFGGKYLISDLCHYMSQRETYTSLTLIRESFGRKSS
jgi:hypothetical protein